MNTHIQELIDSIYGKPITNNNYELRVMRALFDTKASELYEIKQLINSYQEQEQLLSAELKKIAGNKSFTTEKFIYTCDSRKGSIDYSLIKELESVDVEKFRKANITIWKLHKR